MADQFLDRAHGPWLAYANIFLACLGRPFRELVIASRAGEKHQIGQDEIEPICGFQRPQALPKIPIECEKQPSATAPPDSSTLNAGLVLHLKIPTGRSLPHQYKRRIARQSVPIKVIKDIKEIKDNPTISRYSRK
ncbi:hypothetical protein [Sphingomonas sp.]|uniref:hypothetical protein n=1 Tax=Sphingomonas sp. TaxID=28214 RepID=UPI0025FF37A0|nr:hypothetical protein [Sphingomonas sp.]